MVQRGIGWIGLLIVAFWVFSALFHFAGPLLHVPSVWLGMLDQTSKVVNIAISGFFAVSISLLLIRGVPPALRPKRRSFKWWQRMIVFTYRLFLLAAVVLGTAAFLVWQPRLIPSFSTLNTLASLAPIFLFAGLLIYILTLVYWRRRKERLRPRVIVYMTEPYGSVPWKK
ncbi:MAG: hypothetical protein KGJ78_12300 [Alphaproteobacteria bacterium]|nr:hypothetical protein [Alphaproteobacteria bacterium]